MSDGVLLADSKAVGSPRRLRRCKSTGEGCRNVGHTSSGGGPTEHIYGSARWIQGGIQLSRSCPTALRASRLGDRVFRTRAERATHSP